MTPDQLYSWLLSNQLPENDCKLIKGTGIMIIVVLCAHANITVSDDNNGGIAFKCIHEDDLRRLGVSAAGLITISRLKEHIGKYQNSVFHL